MTKKFNKEVLHQAFFNGNGIARRLIISLILFSSALTAVITAIQLYGEYRSDVKNINSSFSYIRQSSVPVLIDSVWVSDDLQIKAQIEGLMNLRDMEYAEITVDGEVRWSAGQRVSERTISDRITLTRNYRGQDVLIGELRVVASLDNIWSRIWGRLIVVLIENGIKTLLVAIFMLLVFQLLVTRHLARLSLYARNYNPKDLDIKDLELDRPANGRWRPDALDYLVNAINDMRHNLRDAYLEMHDTNVRLQESEERLRRALDATNDGVWDWSVMDEKVHYNPGWVRMLGYEPGELAPVYATWERRIHPVDRGMVLERLKAHLDGEADMFFAEHRLKTRQGDWLWVLGRGRVIEYNPDGKPLRAVGTMTDISARKEMEEQLRHLNEELEHRVEERTMELYDAKKQAEQANQAKSEFLSRMSHELRTPMNAILGFSQLLQSDHQHPLTPLQHENVKEILSAGTHLLELINEVLDLARIEAGKLSVSEEVVLLSPVIDECLNLVRPLAEERGIQIIDPGRSCGELTAVADRIRFKQVLLNLLSNAIKYNSEHGTISVTCMQLDNYVQVRVTDSGLGLTKEQQARLFIAFERLVGDGVGVEGTGIGLALSKRLAELMKGEIGVESTAGKGSTFWIRLPAGDGLKGNNTRDTGIADEDSRENQVPGRKQWDVLCIEDNPANMRLIERLFARREDIRLHAASTPRLGIELAIAHQPALILLDINLPELDGYEVLEVLRANKVTRDIPVVAISANVMPKDIERGMAAGFAEYVPKPLDLPSFRGIVEKFLNQADK